MSPLKETYYEFTCTILYIAIRRHIFNVFLEEHRNYKWITFWQNKIQFFPHNKIMMLKRTSEPFWKKSTLKVNVFFVGCTFPREIYLWCRIKGVSFDKFHQEHNNLYVVYIITSHRGITNDPTYLKESSEWFAFPLHNTYMYIYICWSHNLWILGWSFVLCFTPYRHYSSQTTAIFIKKWQVLTSSECRGMVLCMS